MPATTVIDDGLSPVALSDVAVLLWLSDRDEETARLGRQLTSLTAAASQSRAEIGSLRTILIQILRHACAVNRNNRS